MDIDALLPPLPRGEQSRHVRPTDLSQFMRLRQCQRYLRFQLQGSRSVNAVFRQLGLQQQMMPPLLTRSGSRFEQQVEAELARQFVVRDFGAERERRKSQRSDNPAVLAVLSALQPGERQLLLQPRLRIDSADAVWTMQGDVDLLDVRRDEDGQLRVLIADMKSSALARVEHRLQVACYAEMLDALVVGTPNAFASIDLAVLYRGELAEDTFASEAEQQKRIADRAQARDVYGLTAGCLEITDDPQLYRTEVRALVFDRDSEADRIAEQPFSDVPWSLGWQCDSCRYGPFCMREAAASDDLSLIPFLQPAEKSALRGCGVTTTAQLAQVRVPSVEHPLELRTPDDQREMARALTGRSAVAHRLDEFVFRARRHQDWRARQAGEERAADVPTAPPFIPNRGYPSLPASTPELHPNLVRIYLDAQWDYLQDRLYLVSALVTACDQGTGDDDPARRRTIVHHTGGVPDDQRERTLLTRLIRDVIVALNEVTVPDAEGELRAPIHLIFWEGRQQDLLLRALARHFAHLAEATPIYDFLTQMAAFDSSALTVLEREVRANRNYPMVVQSLLTVSGFLGFDWRTPLDFRRLFRARHFDIWQKLDADPDSVTDGDASGGGQWYYGRARFSSSPPLEYAYHAWGELRLGEDEQGQEQDGAALGVGLRDFAVSEEQLCAYAIRRVEAIEHITRDMRTNTWSTRPPFTIPNLAEYNAAAGSLAEALQQFLTLERHTYLSSWRQTRQMTPEERMVAGETLVVRYLESDQEPGIAELNRSNRRKHALGEQLYADAEAARSDPDEKVQLSKDDRARTKWEFGDHTYWLRVDLSDTDLTLDDVLPTLEATSDGEGYVMAPRWTVDSRLPEDEQVPHQLSYRQLAVALRARRAELKPMRNLSGALTAILVGLRISSQFYPGEVGWVMKTMRAANIPLEADALYTLDEDPNDFYGSHQVGMLREMVEKGSAGQVTLYHHLAALSDTTDTIDTTASVLWPPEADAGQQRFLDGLRAMREVGLHGFEASKEAFIGAHGDAPILLVQGPPGTGKSYTTGFAVFARVQGAMAAGQPCRVILSCKTHSATDVLLNEMVKVQQRLAQWRTQHPTLFDAWFDARLLEVPLGRIDPRGEVPEPIRAMPARAKSVHDTAARRIERGTPWSITAAPPAGVRNMLKNAAPKTLVDRQFIDLVVLDEASQMSLPEAIMASLPLKAAGPLVVVGDHRQMAPIVQHDWETERRRTFQDYEAYRSLFDTLRQHRLPTIRFEQSFRVHRDHAAFLRSAIYLQDGINYHSHNTSQMRALHGADEITTAILAPEHPLIVVVHDERGSQKVNPFEQGIIKRVVQQLWLGNGLALDPRREIGVVVPHRAQRAGLQSSVEQLVVRDPGTQLVRLSAVDTVERFQGDEREIIIVSATESDPEYLQQTTSFLLDPRRLTVAISRARQKMILLASRTVFTMPIMDDETFMDAQIWRRLLRETCTVLLWEGEIDGTRTQVWGNPPAQAAVSTGVGAGSIVG